MSPWLLLIPTAAIMLAGSWLSYGGHKSAWWFPWSLGGLAALSGVLWAFAARLSDARTLFSLSICWDAITIISYSLLPLVAFGVRLTLPALAGVVLVVIGACLVKWG